MSSTAHVKVFTVSQVAKICRVADRTVIRWFDSGRLKGYTIPGSSDRRIPREYLIKFLKEHGMPLGELDDALIDVLIISKDQIFIENARRELPTERSFVASVATTGFAAGILVGRECPDCIVIDFSIGHAEALGICNEIRSKTDYHHTILIAVLPYSVNLIEPDRLSINEIFKKPFDSKLLAERIRVLVDAYRQSL
jgi:excisionase family DNA binding protein